MSNYIEINKNAWNLKTEVHLKSDFYENEAFLNGKNSLKEIELNLLGDIKGKLILHLQCHFGQDTISLSRMGAKVTGIDLSDKAIEKAREFAQQANVDTEFINCDIFDLPNYLDKQYDIVFMSYGTIGWLPDLDKWAAIVSRYLKPGGKFIFVEFHPFIWMYDYNFKTIEYNYFNSGEIVEVNEGSYADRNANIEYSTVNWNHSTSEVLNNLIKHNIEINSFDEYNYSPYNCFNHTVKIDADKYQIDVLGDKVPMTFSIVGTRK